MTVPEWLRLLNSQVFFWLTEEPVLRLLAGRAYRGREHDVILFDTGALLSRHLGHAYLSPINSGATLRKPAKRGSKTFRPFAIYDILEKRPAVELTTAGSVPNPRALVVRVERRKGGRTRDIIWRRPEP